MSAALFLSLIMFFLLLLAVIILRREWVALAVVLLLTTLFGTLVTEGGPASLVSAALMGLVLIFLLYRYGLLALSAALLFAHLSVFYPITSELSAWYAIEFRDCGNLVRGAGRFACYTMHGGTKIFAGKFTGRLTRWASLNNCR
jgi:hypothetical protein